MNKNDLIRTVARDTEITIGLAEKVVNSVFDNITRELSSTCAGNDGGEVVIHGFGKFITSHRPAHTGRNPRTGEAIHVEAKNTVKFKASKGLV